MKNNTIRRYFDFLSKIDQEFPIPLSNKTDLKIYAKKLYDLANVKCVYNGENIVAMVAGYIDNCKSNCAYIALVGVLREYRGKGMATKLIREFMKECADKGISRIDLYTHQSNINAINMYKKIGFYEKKDSKDSRPDDVHLFFDVSNRSFV